MSCYLSLMIYFLALMHVVFSTNGQIMYLAGRGDILNWKMEFWFIIKLKMKNNSAVVDRLQWDARSLQFVISFPLLWFILVLLLRLLFNAIFIVEKSLKIRKTAL